jgi:hippurate hydrolase
MRDPVVAAAQTIGMLQSIVSRNVDPLESAVLSITEVKGGTTYNIIPDKVTLRGCTRHFKPYVQDVVETRMKEVLKGLEVSLGVGTEMKYQRRCPALTNSPEETGEAVKAASFIVGDDRVYPNISPVMNSEDFAYMLNSVPGAYLVIGAGQPRPDGMPHQSGYDFNDCILSSGAAYWISLVETLLSEK